GEVDHIRPPDRAHAGARRTAPSPGMTPADTTQCSELYIFPGMLHHARQPCVTNRRPFGWPARLGAPGRPSLLILHMGERSPQLALSNLLQGARAQCGEQNKISMDTIHDKAPRETVGRN